MMNTPTDFKALQYAFAAHLRDPKRYSPPASIEDRRMTIYRDLFYNNIEGFISGTFPVLREVMEDIDWHVMVRDFFATHPCSSPYFLDIPNAFLNYLNTTRQPQPSDLPFMLELAEYEWSELSLDVAESPADEIQYNADGDVLDDALVLTPVMLNLTYQFPVHQISAEFKPSEPEGGPYFLVMYRDQEDRVKFLEINLVTAQLLNLIELSPQHSGRDLLIQLADQIQYSAEQLLSMGEVLLKQLRDKGVVLGTRSASN